MKVFLAGIIQGSLADETIHAQDWREPIRNALAVHLPTAEVYCHFSRHPNSMTYDMPQVRETFLEGVRQAGLCDVLIAYVPSASMGTAIEIYEAANHGALVLTVSPLAANWVLRVYSDYLFADTDELERFLRDNDLGDLLAAKRAGRR